MNERLRFVLNMESWDFQREFNHGFLLTLTKAFFFFIGIFSPLIIWRFVLCWTNDTRRLLRTKAFIEWYTFSWLIFNVLVFISIYNESCTALITFALCWRIYDIIQSEFSLSFLCTPPPDRIPARSLMLVLINYVELILIFASLYYLHYELWIKSNTEALGYSIQVFIPFLSPYIYPSEFILIKGLEGVKIWPVFYAEICATAFTHLFIIQHVLSLFKRPNSTE